jgi:hypothetical protein
MDHVAVRAFDIPEVAILIFSHMDTLHELVVLQTVCRAWNTLAGDYVLRGATLRRMMEGHISRALDYTLTSRTNANHYTLWAFQERKTALTEFAVERAARAWYSNDRVCDRGAGCTVVVRGASKCRACQFKDARPLVSRSHSPYIHNQYPRMHGIGNKYSLWYK